ncbi:DUF389 domain-containing protein [Leifsonia shinshuensis]|uniref:DUF389 domain-containing protein n=1 Tax=Leifsonia shinshuensis TaxID=150026 RepID=UPI00285DA934|nr:DUF389 domain-containing protein [Leifsonia shinshuensis]MDR6970778.1 putative hydrophobic protein (TIGR00271 family) [Leifsonia shinshuensis]
MNTVADMRETVFFEGDRASSKFSRFWLLLCLSSVIAASGVVGDSSATVIGAMIVAPLMTPILGVVLATVTGDRRNLMLSWGMVAAGAVTAVAIGYLVGLLVAAPVVAATNSQVAARVSPSLIDLLAALATGAVGTVALVRKDISDTLPGVAIAISLVPPLSVVGLTLESQAWSQAGGALLLFVANVAAILATGVIILTGYRIGAVSGAAAETHARRGWGRRHRAIISIVVTLLIIGVPLTLTSTRFADQELLENSIRQAAQPWAQQNGWEISELQATSSQATLTLTGEPPVPETGSLEAALKAQGVDPAQVTVQFVPAYTVHLGGGG